MGKKRFVKETKKKKQGKKNRPRSEETATTAIGKLMSKLSSGGETDNKTNQ